MRRPDTDTLIASAGCALAAMGVSGMFCSSGLGRTLAGANGTGASTAAHFAALRPLVLVALAALALLTVSRSTSVSRHPAQWRPAAADAVGFVIGVALVIRILTVFTHNAATAVVLSWLLAALLGNVAAERWWRKPLDSCPQPRPGEVWWARIEFEDRLESKDRPCLVLAGRGRRRHVLMFTSQDKSARTGYLRAPSSLFGHSGKNSFLKTDRLIIERVERFRRLETHADARFLDEVKSRVPVKTEF